MLGSRRNRDFNIYYRTNLSNGFIEGYNNKIKVLKRVSFGIKNFARL